MSLLAQIDAKNHKNHLILQRRRVTTQRKLLNIITKTLLYQKSHKDKGYYEFKYYILLEKTPPFKLSFPFLRYLDKIKIILLNIYITRARS